MLHAFAIGKVLQDLPIGAAAYVREKGPKTLQEAVRLADNYIKDRQYHSSRGQPFRRWKTESASTNQDYSQKEKAPGEKASDRHNKETGSKVSTVVVMASLIGRTFQSILTLRRDLFVFHVRIGDTKDLSAPRKC